MNDDLLSQTISIADLLGLARQLKSEDGENPEYDRALVELIADAAGLGQGDHDTVARFWVGTR